VGEPGVTLSRGTRAADEDKNRHHGPEQVRSSSQETHIGSIIRVGVRPTVTKSDVEHSTLHSDSGAQERVQLGQQLFRHIFLQSMSAG
jgi:hypothetical protein